MRMEQVQEPQPPNLIQASKPYVEVNDIGFSVLHDLEIAVTDIVFVHGLQGHPRKTWTCENSHELGPQSSKERTESPRRGLRKLFSRNRSTGGSKDRSTSKANEVFWPLDLLPEDCANSRILTWGYDSKVSNFFGGPVNQSNITAHARNLLRALMRYRLRCQGRSLIFIAHSLGGIIVKDVLRRAASDADPGLRDIYTSTEAILFLGTPHRGSGKAGIAEVVRKVVSVSGFDTTDQNIRALQVDSTELELIHELFMKLYDQKDRHFNVLTFQEAKGVAGISYLKLNERVVEPFSSSITTTEPTQTINANHMSMCRFPSRDDEGYKQVLGELQILIYNIQHRRDQVALGKDREHTNSKVGSPSQSTTASAAYSLNDVERKCIALLTQNTSNAEEYKASLPRRVEGTCQWILSNSLYVDWNLKNNTSLLWISGYPGSGKTILSNYLLEYLGAKENSLGFRTTLCYFFCDEKIDTQRDGTAILRGLIHQILVRRRVLIKHIKKAYDVQGPQLYQNLNELWKMFIDIASEKRLGPVVVIVDAIDECEETTRERFLQHVMNLIGQAWSANDSNTPYIKFLITSRPIIGRQYTTNLLQIDPAQNYVEQDLRLVIQTKVEGIIQRTRCKPEVGAYLENALYSKADRTFLWVTLVLHLLETSLLASQKDFKRIIDELPKTLTATYGRFLRGIPKKHQPLASKLLHFLVGSLRPLTLDEMGVLVAIEDHHCTLVAVEEDAQPNIRATIEGVLGPLVRIWDSRIYLVHQSLKEFLQILSTQTDNPLSAYYGIDMPRAHLLLAEACVSYLVLDDFKRDLFSRDQSVTEDSPISPILLSSEDDSNEQPWDPFNLGTTSLFKDPAVFEAETCGSIRKKYVLFDYAARHWGEHFSSGCLISSRRLQETVLLLSDATSVPGLNWFRFYWVHAEMNLECPRDFLPMVTASYFGHISSLKSLVREGFSRDTEAGICGIYWASRMGHRDVVDLLLREKFDPDEKALDGQTALIAAVQFNRLDVVKLLLENEGFISEDKGYRVNYAAMGGRTPLSIAAGNGFVEATRQLLQHDQIQPDRADFERWTPLFWSVSGKHLDVVQTLLTDPRVSVNHVDRSGRNVFSWAASAGELEIVQYLLSLKHLLPDEPDRNGRTPFSWAAGNGHLETMAYLRRSKRINVSSKDRDGRNAISWACSGGHYKVVKYLIQHDHQGVDEEDVDGWTPLAWALFNNTPRTVKVLLDSGLVDVNKKDTMGRSALSFAAGYGYLDVVQILLKTKGIEIESKDNGGRTPLSYARRDSDISNALQGLNSR